MTIRSMLDDLQLSAITAASGGGLLQLREAQEQLINDLGTDAVGPVLMLAAQTIALRDIVDRAMAARSAMYIALDTVLHLDPDRRDRTAARAANVIAAVRLAVQEPSAENRWEVEAHTDTLVGVLSAGGDATGPVRTLVASARVCADVEMAEDTTRRNVAELRIEIEGIGS